MTLPYKPRQGSPFALGAAPAEQGDHAAEHAQRRNETGENAPGAKSVLQESALGPFSRKRRRGPGLVFGKPTRRVKP